MRRLATAASREVTVAVGGLPILLHTENAEFCRILQQRYAGFLGSPCDDKPLELEVDIVAEGPITDEDDLSVRFEGGRWTMAREDFWAEWDSVSGRGRIRQCANPYSIDSVLRILHSLVLARKGGLLVHAASAVRNGRAYLFAGVSGAGKTTLARLAPPDVTLLSDEISYLRRDEGRFVAYGTPFAGELAEPGDNIGAPLAALYFLAKAAENTVEPVGAAEATRALLQNICFFAQDNELVYHVFESAWELVRQVPVFRLGFYPDSRVWGLIS